MSTMKCCFSSAVILAGLVFSVVPSAKGYLVGGATADGFAEGVGEGFGDVHVGVQVVEVDFESFFVHYFDGVGEFVVVEEDILLERGFLAVYFYLLAVFVARVF